MQKTIRSYEDLEVWKRGIELTIRVYSIVGHFPHSERFELSAQMRRCAVSIPSNVAEGHGRRQAKPFVNHVNIALGSLAELVTCLVVASRLGFVPLEVFETERRETAELGRMLHGLASSLERRIEQRQLGITFAVIAWFLATATLL